MRSRFVFLLGGLAGVGLAVGCASKPASSNDAGPDGGTDANAAEAAGEPACAGRRVDGRCRVELASGLMHPYSLAVNATHLYWTTTFVPAGLVMRIALSGGEPEVLWTGTATHPNPHTIVLDDASVYFTDFSATTGAVLKMPLGGGTPVALAELQDQPHGLAVDGANVYWTNFRGRQIRKTSKTLVDGALPPVVDLARGRPQPNNLAVDDTFVYWTEYVSPEAGGAIMKTRLDGSALPEMPTTVAPLQDTPYGIVLDAVNIYWTNSVGGQVMKMPRDGAGPPVALASGQGQPFGLAVDAANVYWTSYAGPPAIGEVRKVPREGGESTQLSLATSYAIAVDGTSVYWTTFESGAADGGVVAGGAVVKLTPP